MKFNTVIAHCSFTKRCSLWVFFRRWLARLRLAALNSPTKRPQTTLKGPSTHIVLIGFKHVGKSTIGKALAMNLGRPFIDLDHKIESLFEQQSQQALSCRQIMETHGEPFFRDLENRTLNSIIDSPLSVVSLGGGSALTKENQSAIRGHCIVHVCAPKAVVFQRIMASGKPAFFPSEKDPETFFNELWDRREKVYEGLADFSVNNEGTVESVVESILSRIKGGYI